ncbi:MAG: nuclear transport factor 2 family protein [Candidatus Manganitrophaceae bacterium]
MTNLEVIQELYRCFREKDYDGFRVICTDDLKWIQNEGFPNGATHKGAAAVIEAVFKDNRSEWEGFSYQIVQFLDAGSTIVVIGNYEGLHHKTRKQMRAAAAHVYDLRDGKVCRFRMFADTKPMWDTIS